MEYSVIVAPAIMIITGIIGWLLSRKDDQQAKELATLYRLHDEDSAKLETLQREVDREHYRKNELDSKFDKLDVSIKEGFAGLREDMKTMMASFHAHVESSHKGNQ